MEINRYSGSLACSQHLPNPWLRRLVRIHHIALRFLSIIDTFPH
jgi:hypothetical protein